MSLDIRQALYNLVFLTVPIVVVIGLILTYLGILNGGGWNEIYRGFQTTLLVWSMILFVAIPFYVAGYILRRILLKYFTKN